jgi:stage V sporulation protein G
MRVTGVELVLCDPPDDRVKAYVTITLDGELVLKDAKLVMTRTGMRVSMPARRATGRCPSCVTKNHLLARFCNSCGGLLLGMKMPPAKADGSYTMYHDVVHPTNFRLRQEIEEAVLAMYHRMLSIRTQQSTETI